MNIYFLKQIWSKIPAENLSVACFFQADSDALHALFNITEPSVRAENSGFNRNVWEDSCAELFLSFGNGFYYNFEINCIGGILAQYGKNRYERENLSPKILKTIEVVSTLGSQPFGVVREKKAYRLKVTIPKKVFVFDGCKIDTMSLIGNIYKCADKSPTPHYMTLFDIISEKPDFHRPEFFKKL